VSIQVDSSDFTDLDRVYDRIKQAVRRFGAVLANAGGGSVLALASIPEEQSGDTFGRNVQCVLSLYGRSDPAI
jgi:short-subunit dehydrogenase